MTASGQKRRWIVPVFLLFVAGLAAAVWSFGYRRALDQLAARAESDLALVSDRLSSQLEVFQELAVLMADHPYFETLETETDLRVARRLLIDVADKTGALDIVFAGVSGAVRVSAAGAEGASLADRPAFRRAMHGALGASHGRQGPEARRAYSFAAPAFAADGQVRGALVVRADVGRLEEEWPGSAPAVFFTDAEGLVFITNRPELLFWKREAGRPGLRAASGEMRAIRASERGGHEIWELDWGPYLPRQGLHQARDLPILGLSGEVLVDVAPARRLAGLQAAVVAALSLAVGAMLYLATERRRALAEANAQLERRVEERTGALRDTNQALRREIAERQEAETALKKAQDDLVQAGKLSALGQMSAGISHELNQPLMAIRQFADNGAAFLERGQTDRAGQNLQRIGDMAARAARIIRNLRAFVRNESEPLSKVDLVQVIASAVELTEPRLRSEDIALDWQAPTDPVYVWGGEVRLGQVFVNLINNAADAMVGQATRRLQITLETGAQLRVSIRDNGPGIADPEKIFEPFYSTKAVGSAEGMGLGLSISYGLVQSFGGNIRGRNARTGGAVFTVELEPWSEEAAA